MKLVWNDKECGWECSYCGALYSDYELERVFGYTAPQTPDNFQKSYCMDCGCFWEDVEGEHVEI